MSYLETWNETTPAGTEDKTFGDDRIREFKRAIRERLATEHADITGNAGAALLRHLPGRCAVAFYGTTSEINNLSSPPQFALAFDTSVRSWRYYTGSTWARGDAIPSGTKMIFCQASAPTGWTQDTNLNDRVLRVVSGTGGGTGGTWTISGFTGSVDGTTLTISQIPSHNHVIVAWSATLSGNYNAHQHTRPGVATRLEPTGSSENAYQDNRETEYTGGSQSHTHGFSGLTSDGNWRPSYVNVIVCTKD